jgi:hypothetical protein
VVSGGAAVVVVDSVVEVGAIVVVSAAVVDVDSSEPAGAQAASRSANATRRLRNREITEVSGYRDLEVSNETRGSESESD